MYRTSTTPHAALTEKIIQRNKLQHAKRRAAQELLTEHASKPRTDRIENRHTVKAGHYIVLATIPSKFIWTPEKETKETDKREFVYTESCAKPTTVITGVGRKGQLDQYV